MLTIITSYQDWINWSERYTLLPCIARVPLADPAVAQWKQAWDRAYASEYSALLESGKGGRYTYLALRPESVLRGKDRTANVYRVDENGRWIETSTLEMPPLDAVEQWMSNARMPNLEEFDMFLGGAVGYLAYDVARSLERLPHIAEDDLGLPDILFMRFHEVWIVDHQESCLYCSYLTDISNAEPENGAENRDIRSDDILSSLYRQAEEHVGRMKQIWDRLHNEAAQEESRLRRAAYSRLETVEGQTGLPSVESLAEEDALEASFPKERFIDAVERIQEYIRQGDVYQVNLSVRQSKRLRQDPEEIYEWLRLVNPSPYMGCLRFPDFHVVCGSPELLVKLSGTRITTKPIAGTRKRGADEAEDRRLLTELCNNEKERAEHIMLVDLLRNDIGRVAAYGTVKVEELMAVESYSHVMHLVSTVGGQLAPEQSPYDVLRALFPGGTITGAPKIRTMEIIEELEPVRRGLYTGSIGWIDCRGNLEFNIVIRTMIAKDGIGYIQAGAGIVADSIPEREYKESLNKAKALWKAALWSEAGSSV